MKKIRRYLGYAAVCVAVGLAAQSCAVDEPFGQDGEGTLQMKLVINSDLTRAEADLAELSSNCVVYISGQKGLLHKYRGLENVPEKVNLKNGHYVAEAWTGDSVSASFDKKFFRGYQPFDINGGVENVVLKCRIANVVVSINPATVDPSLMSDWNVNVKHSRASLDFTADNMDYAKGYFMMPDEDRDLTVTVTGKNVEGTAFTKEITLPDVERAHEYILNFAYNPDSTDPSDGGAFLTINVDDTEVEVLGEVELYAAPVAQGVEFDVDRQIVGNQGAFADKYIKISAFGGIEHMLFTTDEPEALHLSSGAIDLPHAIEAEKQSFADAGLKWEETFKEDRNLVSGYLTLSAKWLNSLAQRDTEYKLGVKVTDKYGKYVEFTVRVAVGEGAVVIEDPVLADPVDDSDLMAVLTTKATLTGSIVNAEAVNPGIRYREAGTTDWTFVAAPQSALGKARRSHMSKMKAVRSGGTPFTVTLTGLKPATRYEYQPAADGFEASESLYFTTEGKFEIPNGGFETWGEYTKSVFLKPNAKIVLPGASRESTYWESGNEGSASGGTTLTNAFTDFVHSGSKAASLDSKSVIGVLAAGNIFTGVFVGTDDTKTNGILSLGRDYDGSHPDKVRVWVNYRPGTSVKIKSGNESFCTEISEGGKDCGQIYAALVTENVEIRTNPNTRKVFDPNASCVVAYGQVTFKDNYGADNTLEQLDINLEYKDRANTTKPLKLVIVCAASKYGDYFSGSAGSRMIVDDFQLIYE